MEMRLLERDGFYQSKGELGFKYLGDDKCAALYIPKGTWVHVEGEVEKRRTPSTLIPGPGFFSANRNRMMEDLAARLKANELGTVRKFRAERALVVEIGEPRLSSLDSDSTSHLVYRVVITPSSTGASWYHPGFRYGPMEMAIPDWAMEYNFWVDDACASGIHYYTRVPEFLANVTTAGRGTSAPWKEIRAMLYLDWWNNHVLPCWSERLDELEEKSKELMR